VAHQPEAAEEVQAPKGQTEFRLVPTPGLAALAAMAFKLASQEPLLIMQEAAVVVEIRLRFLLIMELVGLVEARTAEVPVQMQDNPILEAAVAEQMDLLEEMVALEW
jgi:hypothetical protein